MCWWLVVTAGVGAVGAAVSADGGRWLWDSSPDEGGAPKLGSEGREGTEALGAHLAASAAHRGSGSLGPRSRGPARPGGSAVGPGFRLFSTQPVTLGPPLSRGGRSGARGADLGEVSASGGRGLEWPIHPGPLRFHRKVGGRSRAGQRAFSWPPTPACNLATKWTGAGQTKEGAPCPRQSSAGRAHVLQEAAQGACEETA